ncbi:MAG: hypothetical protein KGJ64_04880 [Betaproteobacteria bacterium]|nr:hypothetical protein [Betaproteobacteria bacterium]
MPLPRRVAPETLDGLAGDDPSALRSRRDLQRVHRIMGTRSILLGRLRSWSLPRTGSASLRVLELGAGDGSLLLRVARALAPGWPRVELTLLDRQALVAPATVREYARLGWSATSLRMDVLDWAATPDGALGDAQPGARWDLIVANLFLHHFEGPQLEGLLRAVAARCDHFLACEPRRARVALLGSRCIGLLGANAVTREDAVLSVHAGFRGSELCAAWPEPRQAWHLREGAAGLFSHCFSAVRVRGG